MMLSYFFIRTQLEQTEHVEYLLSYHIPATKWLYLIGPEDPQLCDLKITQSLKLGALSQVKSIDIAFSFSFSEKAKEMST